MKKIENEGNRNILKENDFAPNDFVEPPKHITGNINNI